MSSITFSPGTVIPSTWLNDVNTVTYTTVPTILVNITNLTTTKANKNGDTFTGPLVLSGNATNPLEAVPKQQAESIAAAAAAMAAAIAGRNRVINGTFAVNQRAFAGGTLAAGSYGHDRWKAGAGGCTYTVSGALATITSGTLQQVIEGANVAEGGGYVLSWSGTAQARVDGGAYANSPIVVTGKTAGANTTVEFGLGTVSRVQYETGATPTAYERLLANVELAACQRYYVTSASSQNLFFSGYCSSGNSFFTQVTFPVTMRTTPTVTGANQGAFGFGGLGTLTAGPGGIREERGANSTQTPGFYQSSWTASAEL